MHNKALVYWYPEQTQFCPVKLYLKDLHLSDWLEITNLCLLPLKKKLNNIYERSKWDKASIKSLFSFFILFPFPGNADALLVLLCSWCKGLFYMKFSVCSPTTGRINS